MTPSRAASSRARPSTPVGPGGQPGRHRLLRHPNVVMTPHVGGATHETLAQGAEMIAADIVRVAAARPLVHVLNRNVSAA